MFNIEGNQLGPCHYLDLDFHGFNKGHYSRLKTKGSFEVKIGKKPLSLKEKQIKIALDLL